MEYDNCTLHTTDVYLYPKFGAPSLLYQKNFLYICNIKKIQFIFARFVTPKQWVLYLSIIKTLVVFIFNLSSVKVFGSTGRGI